MTAHPGRSIDFEILALESGLFDTLPPPKPLFGRAVDHQVLRLQSGLFDALPPPPPLQMMHDSLAPLVAAELRGEQPAPRAAAGPRRLATMLGACAGVALMALGVGLRHEEPAAAAAAPPPPTIAPRPTATIVLPEVLIVGDAPAIAPLPAKAAAPSKKPLAAPRAAGPKPAAAPAPAPMSVRIR